MTKVDNCSMSEQELEDKKTEICEDIGITPNKLLLCRNYQSRDTPDIETDIRILEFMITNIGKLSLKSLVTGSRKIAIGDGFCNPRFRAVNMEKAEFEEPDPPASQNAPTPPPPPLPPMDSFWRSALPWAFVAVVIAFFLYLIKDILFKDKYQQHKMDTRNT